MLNNENRIKKRKEFGYIYKNGTTEYSRNLVLMYTTSRYKKVRVGFSISKKVGKAYIRNKIKRQLRAIVRANLSSITPNRNYILIAKPSLVNSSYAQMEKECVQLFAKIS